MNRRLKSLLQKLEIYHPLQTTYRSARTSLTNKYHRLTYRRYKGKGLTCNFCGAVYEKFVPDYPSPDIAKAIEDNDVIAGYGENVYCPNCGSKNRERLLKAVIEKYLPLQNAKTLPNPTPPEKTRLLHFSPEKNLYTWLRNQADITTVDTSPRFYTTIDPDIRYADATRLTFDEKSFDLIIANHILEHIPDDSKAMGEINRVLKEKGVAILQVPYSLTLPTTIEDPDINNPKQQAALYGQCDHVRIYALGDYLRRLENAGFHVHTLTPENLIEFRRYAIQEKESVFLCYKH
jgi:SAM-dependent methyltransferase